MCPVVFLALLLSLLLFLLELTAALSASFLPSTLQIKESEQQQVYFNLTINEDQTLKSAGDFYELIIANPSKAYLVGNKTFKPRGTFYSDSFVVEGELLGHTQLNIVHKQSNGKTIDTSNDLKITVKRKYSTVSTIFIYAVVILVSLNYINMGCALKLDVVKDVLRKPIAPAIGFICQYLIMPLIAYGIGQLIFDETYLRLGLFIFGCSPGGGASNMWTVLLNGNLNLSITMTFISTLSALVVLPLWLFTLGRVIYGKTTTTAPVRNVLTTLTTMFICLGVGLLFQRYLPRVAEVCRKILAPFSIVMIIFIIIFGTYANWFMFLLMDWKIITAAALNVWLGFFIGMSTACILRLPMADRIAIAVETGVQNTGISIVLLGLSLEEPDNDMASVVPVAASVMTPIPLTIALIFMKIRGCCRKESKLKDEKFEETTHQNTKSNNTSTTTLLSSPLSHPELGAGDILSVNQSHYDPAHYISFTGHT